MKVHQKDWVLLRVNGTDKPKLVRCTSESDQQKLKGLVDTSHIEDTEGRAGETVEFSKSDVVANLGPDAKHGAIYGAQVETIKGRFYHDWFGAVRVFVAMKDDEKRSLKKALTTAQKLLQKQRMPQLPLLLDWRHPKGKYAGMYKHRKQDTDVMTIRVLGADINDPRTMYYLTHEYAHGIWDRHVILEERSKWVNIYHEAMQTTVIEAKELSSFRRDVLSSGSFKLLNKELDDDGRKLMRAILKHIKQAHGLDRHHLQLMLKLEDDLKSVWPTYLELGEPEIIFTDYAGKSPEELWAETFSHWIIGEKIPKKLRRALEETLQRLSKNLVGDAEVEEDEEDDED